LWEAQGSALHSKVILDIRHPTLGGMGHIFSCKEVVVVGGVCTANPIVVNCICVITAGSPPKCLKAWCNGWDSEDLQ